MLPWKGRQSILRHTTAFFILVCSHYHVHYYSEVYNKTTATLRHDQVLHKSVVLIQFRNLLSCVHFDKLHEGLSVPWHLQHPHYWRAEQDHEAILFVHWQPTNESKHKMMINVFPLAMIHIYLIKIILNLSVLLSTLTQSEDLHNIKRSFEQYNPMLRYFDHIFWLLMALDTEQFGFMCKIAKA